MRLDALTAEEFDRWRTAVQQRFAELRAGTRTMSPAAAAERAGGVLGRLLPEGVATPGHLLRRVLEDDEVIGDLWLHIDTAGTDAFLYDIRLTPEAVARGLGPAAMDLVELTARDLGATVLRVNVFTGDADTRGLVEGRAYEPTATQMVRRLDGPAPRTVDGTADRTAAAPPSITLTSMTPDQYAIFRAGQEAAYAAEILASGSASPTAATAKAAADMAELLPDGQDTPNQLIWTAYAGDDAVGWLWLEVAAGPDGVRAFVFDIEVRPEFRRRGHGRAIMRAAERESRDRGAVTIGLSVFGHNHGARALYDSLGYEATEALLRHVL